MFKIGHRTIKTAVGASLAILIAQLLDLDYFASAGIITILCIQKTKQKSIKSSWARFLAPIIVLIFAAILFELLGYHVLTIALILLIFIPTTVLLRVQAGISTSSVIMLHLYDYGTVTLAFLLNEVVMIIIGVGVALLMNIYIPSPEKELKRIKKQVDTLFAKILYELSLYVKEGDQGWDGKEITEVAKLLTKGKNVALENLENQLVRYEDQYYHYFKMREKQLDIIDRMLPLLTTIDIQVNQATIIAKFLKDLSEDVGPENTSHLHLEKLENLRKRFKIMTLPRTREEFEARSALFYLLFEIEQYLYIKLQFKPNKNYSPFS